ncbi:MAG TPA: CusA/CzcA family heavy metal efflux RND transporter, partial [Rhodothermales bacterium]|nr:CusA/CzcA family heavy metal efflux RND transporter [Rhodothermales bacterium]
MFERLIAFSLGQRALVLMGTLALVVGGLFAFTRLPIDAIPDVTNNQVQVLTQAPALSPLEVERFVTFPVEQALKQLPDLVEFRSLSRAGISVVTVVFEDGVDTYFARQLILERLREVEEDLPEGVETPELGPVSTGLGEIYRYVVRDTTGRLSPMDLRTVQDWIVRRDLLGVPGLAEVNSIGGELKQFHVLVDPARLAGYGLTLREVFDATAAASGSAGAAYIETGSEQLAVRTEGLVTGIADLQNTVIRTSADGTPVLLRDVAEVRTGAAVRFGAATQDGRGEVVTGFTMQLKGANARVVVAAVRERIEEIRQALPDGVVIEPYYDRTELVGRTIATVARNLAEGALLVIAVLLLFLAHLRAGLILASVIPLSMLFAVICMVLTGQSGNLMSLGAIDFGLIVDGSLIVVENVLRLIQKRQREGAGELDDEGMRRLTYSGAVEVIRSAKFGVFIIIIVYLPIMALQGIEGKLFRPMALTVTYALVGALLLSVTYVPVMCAFFLRGARPVRESPVIRWLHRHYRPALVRVMRRRSLVLGGAAVLFALSLFGFSRLGDEFIPRLDEGDLAIQIIRLPSVSLTESIEIAGDVERRLMRFDEVETIVGNTGRAEISTDPMGFEITDGYVI